MSVAACNVVLVAHSATRVAVPVPVIALDPAPPMPAPVPRSTLPPPVLLMLPPPVLIVPPPRLTVPFVPLNTGRAARLLMRSIAFWRALTPVDAVPSDRVSNSSRLSTSSGSSVPETPLRPILHVTRLM